MSSYYSRGVKPPTRNASTGLGRITLRIDHEHVAKVIATRARIQAMSEGAFRAAGEKEWH